MITLIEFLNRCCGYKSIIIYDQEKNIKKEFKNNEIPEAFLHKRVKDFYINYRIKKIMFDI